jgi:hypothetical protein
MTTDEVIAARVTKYTMDLLRHNTPALIDGPCRCEGCHLARKVISEFGYIQMAARNLAEQKPMADQIALAAARAKISNVIVPGGDSETLPPGVDREPEYLRQRREHPDE